MGKLAGKTMEWLLDAEKQYLEGMPSVKDEKRRGLMQVGLDAVREEIKQRRAQKKGEAQPVPPPPQNTVAEKQQEKNVPEKKETAQAQPPVFPAPAAAKPEQEPKHVMFTGVLTKVPPPAIKVRWADGKVKKMTELELRRYAIDYFRDVLQSKFDVDTFARSVQFNNCVRFLIGLYQFGNDLLPHSTLHPTYNFCGEAMQRKSRGLYEQVKQQFQVYKDLSLV